VIRWEPAPLIQARANCRSQTRRGLAAAKRAGCRLLYTEDLHDGQTIEGILVRNPFAQA
jgi:hypothetical protein